MRNLYVVDGGHASTTSSFKYRWMSLAKALALSYRLADLLQEFVAADHRAGAFGDGKLNRGVNRSRQPRGRLVSVGESAQAWDADAGDEGGSWRVRIRFMQRRIGEPLVQLPSLGGRCV